MGNQRLEANAKGRKVNRRRNTKGQISATKMGLLATKWAYRRRNGLIGDRMGISATEWAYRQRFLFWFGFGTIANGYQHRLPEPSWMVQQLGLDRRKWLLATVWVLIDDGVGSYWRRFGSYWRLIGFLSTMAEWGSLVWTKAWWRCGFWKMKNVG